MHFDFDEIPRTPIVLGLCALIVGANLFFARDELSKKQAQTVADSQRAASQTRAETLFEQQGCIAQALNAANLTSNFRPGDRVVDPLSVTAANPQGTEINSGYVCSSDGSLFAVQSGVVSDLIGTSPKIRNVLVERGFAGAALEMKQHANELHLKGGY